MLLNGIRVLDLSRILVGPFATMMLGDLGAEIIKVEPPYGDDTRYWSPLINGESAYYLSINRNKKSIVINLKEDRGREILYKLVKKSDVFIENFRKGVTEKLRIDYETIKSIKKDIIYCSIHGFDPDSKYGNIAGADILVQAMSGLMDLIGRVCGEPVRVTFALFDIFAGMVAASSILAGLLKRKESGEGIKIDINLFDTSLFSMSYIPMIYLTTGKIPIVRVTSAHPSIVPYQAFKCGDGKYVIIGVFNDKMWINLCKAIGLEELISDPRFKTNPDRVKYRNHLISLIQRKIKNYSRDELVELLRKYGVISGPVYSLDEVFNDEYIREAGIVKQLKHPKLGNVPQLTYPAKINGVKILPRDHPPMMGEHTVQILKELGYTDEEIKILVDDGVVSVYRE